MAQTDLIGQVILGYTVISRLGSGAFGTVYKVQKKNPSGTFTRALKHITIPSGNQYMSVLNSMGGDTAKADSYFSKKLNGIVAEIKNLNSLTEDGARNIVRYYENDIIVQESPRRYDIYILMEYLTPLEKYRMEKPLMVQDVIRLGKDILHGISSCHENGIIHRDVKEDNIFISAKGEFKIGDFGVSKMLQGGAMAGSMKGTPNYLAPEVYLGKEGYAKNVDLYSLGIVLYRLLNYDRNPFLPAYPRQYFPQNEEEAFERRMKGEIPDLPALGGPYIGEVIVKAISGKEQRFQKADQFLQALEQAEQKTDRSVLESSVVASEVLSSSNRVLSTFEHYDTTMGEIPAVPKIPGQKSEKKENTINRHLFETAADFSDKIPPVFRNTGEENEPQMPKKNRTGWVAGIVSLCLVLAIGLFFFVHPFEKEQQPAVSAINEQQSSVSTADEQQSSVSGTEQIIQNQQVAAAEEPGFEEDLLKINHPAELKELPFDTSDSPYPYVGKELYNIEPAVILENYQPENYVLDLESLFAYIADEIGPLRTELRQEDPAAIKRLAEITAYFYNTAGPYSSFLSEKEQTGEERDAIYYDVEEKKFVDPPVPGHLTLQYIYDFTSVDEGVLLLTVNYGFWGDHDGFSGSFDSFNFSNTYTKDAEKEGILEVIFRRGNRDEQGEITGLLESFGLHMPVKGDSVTLFTSYLDADYYQNGKSEYLGESSYYLIKNKKIYS